MAVLPNGVPLAGCRFEILYNKVGCSFSRSKVLFSTNYFAFGTDTTEGEKEARKKFRSVFDKRQNASVAVRAPKDSFSELCVCKTIGFMEADGFRPIAYYTLDRTFVPFHMVKEKIREMSDDKFK